MSDAGPWTSPNAPLAPERLLIRGRIGEETAAIAVDDTTLELERPGKDFFSGKEQQQYELAAIRTFVVREEREGFRLVMAALSGFVTVLALVGRSGLTALFTALLSLAFFASWKTRPKILIDLVVGDVGLVFVAGWSSRAAAHDVARRLGKSEPSRPTAVSLFTYVGQQLGVFLASEAKLRARYREQVGAKANPTEEARFVRVSKRLAIWVIGWILVLPAALVGAPSVHFLLTKPVDFASVLVVAVALTVGFYLLMVCCAFLQSKLQGLARSWIEND